MNDKIEKLEDIVPQDSDFPKTMEFDGSRFAGAEHRVFIDEIRRLVYKIPSLLGLLWQSMNPEILKEDLAILKKHGLPVIPTKIYTERHVSYVDEVRNSLTGIFGGTVDFFRRGVRGVYNSRPVTRMRTMFTEKFRSPIQSFRKLYTNVLGWEFVDMVSDFFSTERFPGLIRKRPKYVSVQPLFQPSRPLSYEDLFFAEEYRDRLFEFLNKGEAMIKDDSRGLDLLGGKAFLLIPGALNRFRKEMYAEVSNILVANEDIPIEESWNIFDFSDNQLAREEGLFAREGDLMLIDNGIYKLGSLPGILSKIKVLVLKNIQEFQNGAMWALLGSFKDYKDKVTDERFNSIPRKIAQWLINRAEPKMKAYAKAKRAEGESDHPEADRL